MSDDSVIISGSRSVLDFLKRQPETAIADKLVVMYLDSALRLIAQKVEPLDLSSQTLGWRVRTDALMLGASGVLLAENRSSGTRSFGLIGARYRPLKEMLYETEISLIDVLMVRDGRITALSGMR